MPAKLYSTVSISGQMVKPQCSKSSPVFTITESAPRGSTSCRPAASLAPPTPPANATTRGPFMLRLPPHNLAGQRGAVLFLVLGRISDSQNRLRLPMIWQVEHLAHEFGYK